jgi:hypothetical protein
LLDGLSVEFKGKPAAVVCTDPFTNSAHEMARAQGVPMYPFAIVRHPFGSATDEELRARAADALPQVLEILARPEGIGSA